MRLNGIGVKLVLTAAAILAVEAAVRNHFDAAANARNFRDDFLKTGRSHAGSVAQAAEYGFLTGDKDELVRVANMLRQADDADLLYVAFYDESGSLLASRRWVGETVHIPPQLDVVTQFAVHRCDASECSLAEHYRFQVPVSVSREVVGESEGMVTKATSVAGSGGRAMAVVGRSYEHVKARTAAAQREMLALSGVLFVVFLGVLFLLARWIVLPIRRLASSTEQVAAGDFETRVDVGRRNDELRVLADSFNRMTLQLGRQRREIVSYSRDLEQKVAQRTAELTRANADLEGELAERRAAERELARSNAELRQFAYVASHDLQEPLRAVTSYVQLLARRYRGRLDCEADEFIDFAVAGAVRMKALITDVLEFSRVGRGARPFQPTDCEATLAGVLANLELAIRERGARVTHDPLPTVMGDAVQLGQVFQNLIGNAIKFCRDVPCVHVSAEACGGQWHFAVRDNGIGIEPQYHERIFAVFQRLHGRDEYTGTGMGLAIAKKIIESHGGRMWIESQAGQGATFHFTIPQEAVAPVGPAPGEEPDDSPAAEPVTSAQSAT